jgi:hypothetical protein
MYQILAKSKYALTVSVLLQVSTCLLITLDELQQRKCILSKITRLLRRSRVHKTIEIQKCM